MQAWIPDPVFQDLDFGLNFASLGTLRLRAGFFMSKLSSRLPDAGYLSHEVKSRVNFCCVFFTENLIEVR